ncbi:MAG: threonine synthase [Ostreibacterium sp.]
MKYVSTRGQMPAKSFTEVLVMGLSPDGGLAVPEVMPKINREVLSKWSSLTYVDLAFEIFRLFVDDIPEADLKQLINNAYNKGRFGHDEVTPLRYLDNKTAILGLSNGPTLAFKDIAMQMIGELFEYVLVRHGKKLNIIGATSGDTGSAAEHAMLGKHNINLFMLSPYGRMSPFQQAQMYGLDEPNIFNIAVKGVFDDCQDIVKAISADAEFKEKYHIGAVNSINWARILSQVVYYFKGYFSVKNDYPNQSVSFCVPSGNFGNIYAGFIAKQMGLPIGKLIVATNENDVLDEFFSTHHYHIRSSDGVHETSSPSMDIGKASNFERYLYHIVGDDSAILTTLWDTLTSTNQIDLSHYADSIVASHVISGKSTHQDRLDTIAKVYKTCDDYIDPHTADGVFVARHQQRKGLDDIIICLETALPTKFEATVEAAIGHVPQRPAGYESIETMQKHLIVIDNDTIQVRKIIEKNS